MGPAARTARASTSCIRTHDTAVRLPPSALLPTLDSLWTSMPLSLCCCPRRWHSLQSLEAATGLPDGCLKGSAFDAQARAIRSGTAPTNAARRLTPAFRATIRTASATKPAVRTHLSDPCNVHIAVMSTPAVTIEQPPPLPCKTADHDCKP